MCKHSNRKWAQRDLLKKEKQTRKHIDKVESRTHYTRFKKKNQNQHPSGICDICSVGECVAAAIIPGGESI